MLDISKLSAAELQDLKAQLEALPKEVNYLQCNGFATVPKGAKQEWADQEREGVIKVAFKVKFGRSKSGNACARLTGKVPFDAIEWK